MQWDDIRPVVRRSTLVSLYHRDGRQLEDRTYLRDISGRLREHLEMHLSRSDLDVFDTLEARRNTISIRVIGLRLFAPVDHEV